MVAYKYSSLTGSIILVATQALVHYLICLHSPSGAARPRACVYISGNALLPVLQLLHVVEQNH